MTAKDMRFAADVGWLKFRVRKALSLFSAISRPLYMIAEAITTLKRGHIVQSSFLLLIFWILSTHQALGALTTNRVRISTLGDDRVMFDLSGLAVTGMARGQQEVVTLNPRQERGMLLSESGEASGVYEYHEITTGTNFPARLLKVMIPTAPPSVPEFSAHFFLNTSAEEGTYFYIGSSDVAAQAAVDARSPQLLFLVKLLLTDEPIGPEEPEALFDYRGPLNDVSYHRSSGPVFAHYLLEAAAKRRLDFDWYRAEGFALRIYFRFIGGVKYDLPGAEMEMIISDVEFHWAKLNAAARFFALTLCENPPRNSVNRVGALFLDYLDSTAQKTGSEKDFLRSYYLLPTFIEHFSLDSELRTELAHRALRPLRQMPGRPGSSSLPIDATMTLLNHILDEDLSFERIGDFTEDIGAYVQYEMNHWMFNAFTAGFIFSRLQEFVTAEGNAKVCALLEEFLTDWESDRTQDLFFARIAFRFMNGPLNEAEGDRIRRLAASVDFSKEAIIWMNSFFESARPEELERNGLAKDYYFGIAKALKDRFGERPAVDTRVAPFDTAVQALADQVKRSSAAEREWLVGLLHAYNPPQPGESAEDFTERRMKVDGLWLTNGVFIMDRSGGVMRHPEFLKVISEYCQNHPDWIDVLVFSTSESAEAASGAVQVNFNIYNNVADLGEVLLHEGGHSLHLRDRSRSPSLKFLPDYWFREASAGAQPQFITPYQPVELSQEKRLPDRARVSVTITG